MSNIGLDSYVQMQIKEHNKKNLCKCVTKYNINA
jgi:hypothetical protein